MPLNRRETIQLARAIEERREALTAEIRHDMEVLADRIGEVGDAEVTRDVAELESLEAARKRMEDGSYGLCVDCGAEIPFERLLAELGAARCVACQERHEKTYRT